MPKLSPNGFLLAALAGAILNVQAAETEYNLLDVYNLAQKNDAQLAAAHYDMQAIQEQKTQSRATLLPSLTLSANTQYTQGNSEVSGGKDLENNGNSHGWGATLNQPLFRMANWYGYDQAKSISAQAELRFSAEEQSLILRTSEAYFNVLRAEDSLISAKAEEKAVKQQLDQARERYNVGLIAETDVLEAQAGYDAARVARILGENQVSVSYEALRTITNHDITQIGSLQKAMPVNHPVPASADDWVNSAVSGNLSLQVAREGLEASQKNIKVQKAGHAPTVDAFARYNYNSDHLSKNRPGEHGGLTTGKGDSTVVGLQFNMELFGGGATSSRVRQATYQMESVQQNFDKSLRETSSSTRNLFRTVNSDVDRVDARCQGIVSSESALNAVQSGYEVGTRNITDVLDAQKNLFSAERDYLNARYDYIVNTMRLKQVAGTLSPTDLQELNQWIVSGGTTEDMSIPAQCRAN
ncbi:TolC family outer membrane protein [Endozoicomonas lisbonensis]|uniref:Outer membrane protein n=1 Tax=Endozoicomonas lisbonensis TaxID=3120522 RepID=A0ABV2SKB9_9GAMM